MEIAYFGRGPVGDRCRKILEDLKVKVLEPYTPADFWISVHWDKIFTKGEIAVPREGVLNVHNSFLPWNRGAHATTWAIVDQTPHGATMHWIDGGIDTGDIFYQEPLQLRLGETADELYQRTVELEVKVFHIGMLRLLNGDRSRTKQVSKGTFHLKSDFERLIDAMSTRDTFVVRK